MTDRKTILPAPPVLFSVRQALRRSPSHRIDDETPAEIADLADELEQLLKRITPKE